MPLHEVIHTRGVNVNVFTDEIEDAARQQLIELAESGICVGYVAAMPDVHYGAGATIGSVFASDIAVSPNAVGVDIGCGMFAFQLSVTKQDIGLDVDMLKAIHAEIKRTIPTGPNFHVEPIPGIVFSGNYPMSHWLKSHISLRTKQQLGTLGGGNHFIEICYDTEDNLWAVIHSGSRAIGKAVADFYNDLAKAQMRSRGITAPNPDLNHLLVDSDLGQAYLQDMEWCQHYALENREKMRDLVLTAISTCVGTRVTMTRGINVHHNYCTQEFHIYTDPGSGEEITAYLWVTRKGAVDASFGRRGVIPGSMATGSYITEGLGNELSWRSSSHGAGRKLSRRKAMQQISQEDFVASMSGIVSETVPELRDEATQAYKDLDSVMVNQKDLVRVVTKLTPVLNVKGYETTRGRKKKLPDGSEVVVNKLPVRFSPSLTFERYGNFQRLENAYGKSNGMVMFPLTELELRIKSGMVGTPRTFWMDTGEGSTLKRVDCVVQEIGEAILLQVQEIR